MADGSLGLTAADDSGADTPQAGAVVRHAALGPGLDRIGHGQGAGTGDPHTVGRWAAAFGEGGPTVLMFEQSGGSPLPSARRSRRI